MEVIKVQILNRLLIVLLHSEYGYSLGYFYLYNDLFEYLILTGWMVYIKTIYCTGSSIQFELIKITCPILQHTASSGISLAYVFYVLLLWY